MAKITLTLERETAQKLLDAAPGKGIDPFLMRQEQKELVAALRAALDAPPVEERVEWQIVSSRGVLVYPAEASELSADELRQIAREYAEQPKVASVRIQSRTVSTTPWVDVEEGE
jgi:hypothetical protein